MTSPNKRTLFYFVLALTLLIGAAGCDCGDDDDDDDDDDDQTADDDDDDDDDDAADDDDDDDSTPNVDDLIEEGKDWLAFPEGDRARLSFLEALELAPGHPEALYGVVLSDTVHTCDLLSIITDYVVSFLEYGGPVKDGKEVDGDDLLNGIAQRVLDGLLRERVAELLDYADQSLEAGGSFTHEGIPIFINFEQVAELSYEFDDAELYATQAFAGLFDGLIYHLYSVDLDFDLSNVFRFMDLDFGSMTTTELLSVVVEILLGMFTDPSYPDFLTIPDENAQMFKEAGMEMGDGLADWLLTFDAVNAETDDQADDVIAFVDSNNNSVHDPGEPYVIPHFGELTAGQMALNADILVLVEGLRNSFYDYTEKDIDPNNPNPLQLVLLRPIVEQLGLPGWLIPNMELDIGAWYVDPAGSGLKDTLVLILRIADLVLPDYSW